MDNIEETEFEEESRNEVSELVEELWETVEKRYGEGLSEEEIQHFFAALGIMAGMGMNQAFKFDQILPFHLQGIMSDFTYQTMYSDRYGINFDELDHLKRNSH